MGREKALFVVNSVYQLLTAVHLRRCLPEGWEGELLLTDLLPEHQALACRGEETGVFSRVLLGKARELQERCHLNRPQELEEVFGEGEKALLAAVEGELGDYSQVYFANCDALTRLLACRYYHSPTRFFWFEDGFSSYVIDYLREDRAAANRHREGRKLRDKLHAALLYRPDYALRGDGVRNLPLPPLPAGDLALLEILDHLFQYRPLDIPEDVVFLEQSFRAENIPCNDLELMELCRQALGPGRFLVKPHPRNGENLAAEKGLSRPWRDSVPWELYLLHGDCREKTVVTVCSNGALTGRLALCPPSGERTVLLYRLFEGKVLWKEDALLRQYLERFRREFQGRGVLVPQTRAQLEDLWDKEATACGR